jgi:riboflavin biosynthesis pyrimidine reductase
MRVLVGPDVPLSELYAAPEEPWLRVNMVATVDGAAAGTSGTSRSINNDVDKVVFDLLRAQADVLVVGAGTLRDEGYAPNRLPIVAVSRSASVPPTLRGCEPGKLLLATVSHADRLEEARSLLGEENVLVLGSHRVDLAALRSALVERGFRRILCEGGPHLLRDLLDQGVLDELCQTVVPRLVGGTHPRILDGPPVDATLRLHVLLEHDGTLLGRWLVDPPGWAKF